MESTNNENTIYVLDSSIFIHSLNTLFENKPIITTHLVEEEMKSSKASLNFEHSKLMGMEILYPSKESINTIKNKIKKTNDKLSETDISVIALALDFKNKNKNIVVATEDYGIQNICAFLEIPFTSLLNKPIKNKFKWIKRCANCGRIIKDDICSFCGSKEVKYTPKK